ncbi:MAG: endosialidase [Cellulosilyticum sp.]|nr:endosialidase [Cellulosilyticum sp.]
MAVVKEIIRVEENGALSFGNYELKEKTKVLDFEVEGRLYKAKTFYEVTKLKRDGALVYESLPGTAVHHFKVTDNGVSFSVEGEESSQITLELEPETEYKLLVDDLTISNIKTTVTGKISFSVDCEKTSKEVQLKRIRA